MKTVAVILAGGTGARIGSDTPKQLREVGGKTILEHSLQTFHDVEQVDEILIVMPAGYIERAQQIVDDGGYKKVTAVIAGGNNRTRSSAAAIDHLGDEECKVLFHDAARPFVSARIITDCITALDNFNAVGTVIESTDTIVEVDGSDQIASVPQRESLRRVQTPQGFKLSTIRSAYDIAMRDPAFTATDDCSVVLHALPDEPIHLVRGSETNIKITHAMDMAVAEAIAQRLREDTDG